MKKPAASLARGVPHRDDLGSSPNQPHGPALLPLFLFSCALPCGAVAESVIKNVASYGASVLDTPSLLYPNLLRMRWDKPEGEELCLWLHGLGTHLMAP